MTNINLIGIIDIFLLILYSYLFIKADDKLLKLYILFGGLNELCWTIDILFEKILPFNVIQVIVSSSYIFDWFVAIFGILIIFNLLNFHNKKIKWVVYGFSLIFLISLIIFPPNRLNTSQFVVQYWSSISLGISSIIFITPIILVMNEILLGNKIKDIPIILSISFFIIGEEIIGSLVFVGFWQGYLTEALILAPLFYSLYSKSIKTKRII